MKKIAQKHTGFSGKSIHEQPGFREVIDKGFNTLKICGDVSAVHRAQRSAPPEFQGVAQKNMTKQGDKMKHAMTVMFSLLVVVVVSSLSMAADQDLKGSKDHPLLTRIPNFFITDFRVGFNRHNC